MKKIFVLLLVFVFYSFNIQADTAKKQLEKKYDSMVDRFILQFRYGFWSNYFIQNGNRYGYGMAGGDYRKLVSVSPLAKEEMEAFRKKRIWGWTFAFLGLGTSITSIFIYSNNSDKNLFYGLYWGGFAGFIIGMWINETAINNALNAMHHYNQYIIKKHLFNSQESLKNRSYNILQYSYDY
ncbi:MAG: hypothetical protein KKH98_00460 [Spirochaetes bacterium]|nr:hypothetical protein [Spirochaetota bacterium]